MILPVSERAPVPEGGSSATEDLLARCRRSRDLLRPLIIEKVLSLRTDEGAVEP